MISVLQAKESPCFISGDKKIDLLSYDSYDLDHVIIIEKQDFSEKISTPSRETPTSWTLIDHIIHNLDDKNETGVLNSDITDHIATYLQYPIAETKSNEKNHKLLPFSKQQEALELFLYGLITKFQSLL